MQFHSQPFSRTLQAELVQGVEHDQGSPRLYLIDEASLTSTRQMREFLGRLDSEDRVVLVGDTRQHQGVEAGRPFEQLQEHGMQTAKLDEIVRQRDPELKQAVEHLARGNIAQAVDDLEAQGRVTEIQDRARRIETIALTYGEHPESTLVVAPDNASRCELNRQIHHEWQKRGVVNSEDRTLSILVPRQDLTGAERQWAERYEQGDIIRYSRTSKAIGIKTGEYVRVIEKNSSRNTLTVERGNGEQVSYDPKRLSGVSVYREAKQEFSVGDRIQFTAPNKKQGIANRELGIIEQLTEKQMRVHLDSGKRIEVSPNEQRHFDYGYAVTSHSSQGLTADRVLVHVDTEHAHRDLINARMAYVSVSRARYDAHIYTNDAANLGTELGREVSKRSIIKPQKEPRLEVEHTPSAPERAQTPEQPGPHERHIRPSHGFSMER